MKFIIFLLCFLVGSLQAQTKLVDKLLAELPNAPSDSAKAVIHSSLSAEFLFSNAKSARQHAQQAVSLAAAVGDAAGKVKALNLLGTSHLMLAEYEKALQSHYEAKKLAEQLQDTTQLTATYIKLGSVHYKIKDQDRALDNFNAAAELARLRNDELSKSRVFNNIGNIYEEQGEYAKALDFFRKAAGLQQQLGNVRSLSISLHNIGNVHLYLGQPAEGLPYLFKSLHLSESIGNDMMKITTLGRIARIYQALGKKDEALQYATQSFGMAEKAESGKKMAEAAELLQSIYAERQDYEKAYAFLAAYIKHTELLTSENRAKIEAEITARHEIEQKEQENELLKAEWARQEIEIKLQRNSLLFEGALIILMLVLVVVLYKSRQRIKGAYAGMKKAHFLVNAQKSEILKQKNEIFSQALALQEQNKQLEKHSFFKNKVFTIISHDLRSPFSSLKGLLGLVQRGKKLSDDEMKFIFGLLSKNMDNVSGMLDNVLIWAKAQLEESGVKLQPLRLHEVVEENLQLVKAQAEEKEVCLCNEVTPDTVAMADRERLNFVLRNLLMNALKFSYPGGKVSVQVREQDGETALAVSDNGKGMTAIQLSMLFTDKRFSTPGTSQEKGTGLGLMLCKELLEGFGGKITVESHEGKGSVFSIIIPQPCPMVAGEEKQTRPEPV